MRAARRDAAQRRNGARWGGFVTKALRARARRAGEPARRQQRRARSTPPPRARARRGVLGKAGVVAPPPSNARGAHHARAGGAAVVICDRICCICDCTSYYRIFANPIAIQRAVGRIGIGIERPIDSGLMRLKSGWAAHQWPHHRVTRLTCAQAGRGGAYTALICSRAKGTRDGFGAVAVRRYCRARGTRAACACWRLLPGIGL